jgi:hypothetical protein
MTLFVPKGAILNILPVFRSDSRDNTYTNIQKQVVNRVQMY